MADVIDTAPLPGTVTPRDAVPTHIQTGTARQIADERAATIGEFINNRFGGVYINEAQSNRYEPDVLYRGFVASPLLGNPIGLSVFIDSMPVNESFGDAVLWRGLIPQAAMRVAVQATAHLNAMNSNYDGLPWELSFSYARALQGQPMELWGGDADKVEAAQKAFHHRAKMNSAARSGNYSEEMEDEAA